MKRAYTISMLVDICFFMGALVFILYLVGEVRIAEKDTRDVRMSVEKGVAFESGKREYRCFEVLSEQALKDKRAELLSHP